MDARTRVKTFSVFLSLSLPFSLSTTFPSNSENREQETMSTYPMIFQIFFFFSFEIDGKKKRIGKERNEEKVAKFGSPLHRDYFCARI